MGRNEVFEIYAESTKNNLTSILFLIFQWKKKYFRYIFIQKELLDIISDFFIGMCCNFDLIVLKILEIKLAILLYYLTLIPWIEKQNCVSPLLVVGQTLLIIKKTLI